MKKVFYLSIAAITFGLVSCQEYLDKRPDLGFTEEILYNDFQSIRGYFDRVYNILDDYRKHTSQNMRGYKTGEMSDEGANVFKQNTHQQGYQWQVREIAQVLNAGLWLGRDDVAEIGWNDANVNQNYGRVIPKSFYGIRISNRILDNVPRMEQLTEEQKNQLMGQAYFFRGWFYFEIIRRVGGMPILDRLYNSDDTGDMPRLTYAESSDWIIENMNYAIELLPDKWEDLQTGRPTKSSAYALKSMAQLYAASPLMRNGLDATVQYDEYDADRVQLAAEYAWDCLKYIENNKAVYDQTMMPGNQYAHIFYHPKSRFVSQESLWYVNSCGAGREEDVAVLWQSRWMTNRAGNMGTPNFSPSQNMINKFETVNGYPAELTATGWICADPAFNPDEPYKDRDPRLHHSILLPGERFGTRQTAVGTEGDANAWYLSVWPRGQEYSISGSNEGGRGDILTRYLAKKYQWPESNNGASGNANPNYSLHAFNSILIRTTQVWLDYAEAMNEAYGPVGDPEGYGYSAVDALNEVRRRVGQGDVRSEYAASKEALRERIRNERAVELMFENHRWFDIRRWMIAEQLFAGDPNPIKGTVVTIRPDAPPTVDVQWFPPGATVEDRESARYGKYFNYTLNTITEEIRVFERRNYWYPIRNDEINRYPTIKQNPGW
ncbi:MAG: RagB/SusD family nutrient uptake outer membrane protein [Bacteroidales bacterium]|jgi:hypothetical protein|nr:RagB/SusD family nutrient uptake outer membrane protein [Bacteroidales bacterium]